MSWLVSVVLVCAASTHPQADLQAEAWQQRVYAAWTAGDLYTARQLALTAGVAHPNDALLAEYELQLAVALSDGQGAATALQRLKTSATSTSAERLLALEAQVTELVARDGDGEHSVQRAQVACAALALVALVLAWLGLAKATARPG